LKILLDHNLDKRLKNYLLNHETSTAQELGWADLLNGDLLTLAEQNNFNVLLTADSNIKNQQALSKHNIAILILRALNNRLLTHLQMIDGISSSLGEIKPGHL
jgi:predicted nuclease of predicted toxin-antitoxin system